MDGARGPTSSDVAREAGLSRSTVKEILNGRTARFPESTVERVKSAADRLGYTPSLAGRSLKTGRSGLVLVLAPPVRHGPDLQDIVESLADTATAHGRTLIVQFARVDLASNIRDIRRLRPEAVVDLGVLNADAGSALQAAGVVVVPRGLAASTDWFHREVGRTMTRRLTEGQPSRRLIYAQLADGRADLYGPLRLAGMREQALAQGIDPPSVVSISLVRDDAVEALRDELPAGDRVGVACYNDAVATAVLAACRCLGRRVPDDVAVIGVDGTSLGQLVEPRLTSVVGGVRSAKRSLTRELGDVLAGRQVGEPVHEAVVEVLEGESV